VPLLQKCARNAVVSVARRRASVTAHEAEWPSYWHDRADVPAEVADGSAGPEQRMLRAQLWETMVQAIGELKPGQRRLLVAHYLEGRSIQELAAEDGRSPNAAEQALHRALVRLRGILARHGVDESEARSYLFPPPHPTLLGPIEEGD
jgi:RNA polymerase sigma factor (sigma-70 family)